MNFPQFRRGGGLRQIPMGVSVALIFYCCMLPTTLHALVFTIPSGRVKCITEELRAHSMSVAHYRIAESDDGRGGFGGVSAIATHKISAKVSDPEGESIHHAESVDSGQFAFVAAETGPHSACFWSPKFELSTSVSVDFEWKTGVMARDWPSVAKKGKIDGMEMELKKLEDSVNSIQEEMVFLREREEEMQKLNETTSSRMGLLSLLSLFLCLSVAGLQLWHLKAFFEREKIL